MSPIRSALKVPSALLLVPLTIALAPLSAAVPSQGGTDGRDLVCSGFDPANPGSGALYWRSPTGLAALPVLDMDVQVEVSGIMVRGTVTQTFKNQAPVTIEAVYVFPLPENAAVHHMEMRIGERRIVSVVREREEARQIYQQAVREGRKAALVEQQRPNLFQTSASNINPGETVLVVLEYIQEISYADGEFSLHFPLTLTPRFAPPRATPDEEARSPFISAGAAGAPLATIVVRIRAGFPLKDVASPSHDVRMSWDADMLIVEPRTKQIAADRDFLLAWRPLLGKQPQSVLLTEGRDDGRYALMMLLPPSDELGPARGLSTETLFIVDVSGSMQGPSIEQARTALAAAIRRLHAGDTFNVIAFNHEQRVFSGTFVPASGPDLEAALQWVGSLRADGGTMICPALRLGLSMLEGRSSGRVQRIIFFTDGAVENEDELFRSIIADLGPVRLHALGIGSAPNRYLMRRMAEYGRGLCDFIGDSATAGNRIDAFLTRLDRPVMTDLELRLEGAAAEQTYPATLPDLHAGEPLVVSLKLSSKQTLCCAVLTGRVPGGPIRLEMPLDDLRAETPHDAGVAVRWARAKIESLMQGLYVGSDPAIVRKEVVEVSKSFNLVSPYTSLVAVEEIPTANSAACPVHVGSVFPTGSEPGGELPQGGTNEPLLLLLGLALLTTGAVLLRVPMVRT